MEIRKYAFLATGALVLDVGDGFNRAATVHWTPGRRTVPLITARRGLSPPKHSTCVAHKKNPDPFARTGVRFNAGSNLLSR